MKTSKTNHTRMLFRVALTVLDMTTKDFAKTVVTENGIGVHPHSVDHYLRGRLPSRNIEAAVDALIEQGLSELRKVVNEHESKAA